jgi:hypothetical protein
MTSEDICGQDASFLLPTLFPERRRFDPVRRRAARWPGGRGPGHLPVYDRRADRLLGEPVQSIRNRLQRMYKHGFCRRYTIGIRHLVYAPHWLSRGQNLSLLHDLMGSRFRVTLTLATRQCPEGICLEFGLGAPA